MDYYNERIKPLFLNSMKTNADLEREIGIPPKKIYQWNTGKLSSYQKYIPQIAAYFHVSADYLLGRTDDPLPATQKEKPTTENGDELSALNHALLKRLLLLTPQELESVDAFVQGLLAARGV